MWTCLYACYLCTNFFLFCFLVVSCKKFISFLEFNDGVCKFGKKKTKKQQKFIKKKKNCANGTKSRKASHNKVYFMLMATIRTSESNVSQKNIVRNSRPEVFCKKGVLWNFAKFTRKHLCQSLFFNNVAALGPQLC